LSDKENAIAKRPEPKSTAFMMEINLPGLQENGDVSTIFERKRSVHFGDGDNLITTIVPEKSEAGYSAVSAITYHSACDAMIVGGDGEAETVQAEVINVAGQQSGGSTVKIAFRSQCLRTQNEWQRQLLQQQRSIVETMSTKLEDAQQKVREVEDVQQEEKELLRGFRKIVTREVDLHDSSLSAEVFLLEKSKDITAEIQELCQILELPCHICKSFTSLKKAVTDGQSAQEKMHGIKSPKRRPSTISLHSKLSRHTNSTSSTYDSQEKKLVCVVFLGKEWVTRELPPEWKNETVYVALTSQPEEFEDIGRKLVASGSSEIHERLLGKGFSEYLLHPLSLESLRQVLKGAMCHHFGHEYLLTKVIGRGSSSVVYRAKRLRDGALFALKEINAMRMSKSAQADIVLETELLRSLCWPTVMELVDAWCVTRDKLRYLLMPLLEGGDIEQYMKATMKQESCMPVDKVSDWLVQTLHGLSYMHHSGVLHRDIKPGNLLITEEDRVLQIADLGHAARLPGPGPHPARRNYVRCHVCTPLYSAPEVSKETAYTASDVWSTGATFYEMLTLKSLFSSTGWQRHQGGYLDPHLGIRC
jgi:hypothetical protein